MKLYEHLKQEAICLDLKSQEKKGAIVELAELLKDDARMADFEAFLAAVFAREKDGTTGIGDGVAVPHARTDSVKDFVAAVGLSKSGIEFEALDGKPVRVVILMGIPTPKVKPYLRLLAHLSLLLKQKDFIRSLLESRDAQGVLEVFAAYEE